MSRTKTTTIRVRVPTPQEKLMQEIIRSCPAIEALPTHERLAALAGASMGSTARGGVGLSALDRLQQRRASVVANSEIDVAVRTADPESWAAAERLLGESREAFVASPSRAETLAEQGDRALCRALEGGARALAIEERAAASAIIEDALQSIGCRTTTALEPAATGIWAERGHELVAVLIEDGGAVKIDVAGFGGSACAPFHEEIERAVVERGGVFEHVDVAEHADPSGGVLIRSAARAAGPRGDMARAIARQAPPPLRFSSRRGASASSNASRLPNRGRQ